MTSRLLCGFATIVTLIGTTATQTSQRPKLEQSVDLLVPVAPVVLDVGGTPHLVHELHITNMRRQPVALHRLQVIADGGAIADLNGQALTRTLQRIGVPRDALGPHVTAPGQRMVSYLWIPLSKPAAPRIITHRLELTVQGTEGILTVEGATVHVSTTAPVALGPPLSGGPWVAIYDPLLMGGHRTAIYSLDGKARIPGRFAIDWIRAPAAPETRKDKPADNGFGADVLAVADARVASAVDDMPDLPAGMLAPSQPVPMEQASGNYVALDFGGGRFAFYEHLKQNSIRVKAGDRVRIGQVIAQLGSSGSTSVGPHLHFHVADANATLAAEGHPFVFRRFQHLGAYRSLEALVAGEPWIPAPAGESGVRQQQHPAPVSVVQF